jgi:hypothetical protein
MHHVRFEVLMVVKLSALFFWVDTNFGSEDRDIFL